jgi:hypothetical protein
LEERVKCAGRISSSVVSLAVLAVVAETAVGGSFSGRTASAASCTPTVQTIKNVTVSVSCGPAKATVTYKGKTYKFTVGRCHTIAGGFFVDIGKTAALGDKPVAYAFDLGVPSYPKPHDGTYTSSVTLVWQIPGHRFQLEVPYAITLSAKLRKGTFTGPVIGGGSAQAKGSWTC